MGDIMRIPPREQAVQGFPVNRSFTKAESDNRYALKGGTGTLTLQTNGTNNGSQSLFNLKNGTGITVVDDGAGGVTITATGGGTGTVTSVTSSDVTLLTVATGTTTPVLTVVSAPKLQTARAINGVNFDGTGAITVTAAAGTVTGTTLNSTVVSSSLTSVGTLTAITVTGNITNSALTASKVVFTDASKNLTSTGIGTSSQFIKADGSLDSSTYITGNQTITLSGDVTGSGATSITTTLATVNSNVGSFGSATVVPIITVNGKGLVTAVTTATITPAASSITGGAALTKTNDTNVTLTLGGTPSTALLVATSLALGWTGTLANTRGGTGQDSSASTGVAQVSSGTWNFSTALANGTTATTQSAGDNSTKVATTAYTDSAVATGIASVNAGDSVDYTTSAILPNSPIYNNGASGVGATITTLTTNTALIVDGGTPTVGQEVLVKNEGDSSGLGTSRNGIFVLTTIASLGVAWILTRATDYNSANDINSLGLIYTRNGGTTGGSTGNAGISYALVARITTVGTDSITYQVGAPKASTIITTSTSAGGDLGGTYPNPTVLQLTGAKNLIEQWGGNDINSSIGNNTYTIQLYSEYGCTINELKIISGSGTCTAAVKIGSTSVTGISAVSVSSSIATGTASAANTVNAGDKITLVLSSTSSLNNLQWTLKTTRT